MLLFLILAATFAVTTATSSQSGNIIDIVNLVLKDNGIDSQLILEVQGLKEKLDKQELKIEHMAREIGNLKLTMDEEKRKKSDMKRELMDLKLADQRQIAELRQEIMRLQTVRMGHDETIATKETHDKTTATNETVSMGTYSQPGETEVPVRYLMTLNKDNKSITDMGATVNSQYEDSTSSDKNLLMKHRKPNQSRKRSKNQQKNR